MAITVAADLDASQVEIYDAAVLVTGENLASLDGDGSVTYGGSINGADNIFTIYTKLDPVVVKLTDGTEVTPITMADAKVTITPEEYGNVITTTKLAGTTTAGKADLGAAKLIGINIIESPNAKGVSILEGATNSTAAATPGTLATADLRAAYTKFASAGVMTYGDGRFRARLHPEQVADLKDAFIAITQYATPGTALQGEVGYIEGFTLIEDRSVTAGTVICYGDNCLGKSESHPTQPTIIDGTDNLGRNRNYGWYGIYQYGIVDQNSVELITTA